MALTYTVAGAACAAAGKQVQAVFQQPWILVLFAALFVALALSMFGLFTLQMPAAIQTRLADISNQQRAGTFGGVAVMGALSALIVTTCVGPALVGALLVISQTGQIVRGGAALFAMSIGMGTPLLVVGASAGKLLPKAGAWMDTVKKLFGVMMLAVAAWMLARIVPERARAAAVGRAGLVAGVAAVARHAAALGAWLLGLRALGVAAALYGVALAAGARPGRHRSAGADTGASPAKTDTNCRFAPISSVADLDRAVAQRALAGRRRAARLLRRLVHLLQGDGALHLHRPRRAAGASGARCCCAPTSPTTTPTTRRC